MPGRVAPRLFIAQSEGQRSPHDYHIDVGIGIMGWYSSPLGKHKSVDHGVAVVEYLVNLFFVGADSEAHYFFNHGNASLVSNHRCDKLWETVLHTLHLRGDAVEYLEACKDSWLIKSIGEENIRSLIHNGEGQIRHYRKGQIVHHFMDPCETLDVILSGELTINKYDADGSVVHITRFNACDTLGGNLLFATQNIYPFDISAMEETALLQVSRKALTRLLHDIPDFLTGFLQDLSDKALLLTRTIHILSERSLRQQILQFLLLESQRQQSRTVVLKFTKKLMAERFGVARTSLSRELKAMQDEGLILMSGTSITLQNLEG